MKLFIATLAIAAMLCSVETAQAAVTCQRIGTFTYCTDTDTGQTWTCQQIGTFTYCN